MPIQLAQLTMIPRGRDGSSGLLWLVKARIWERQRRAWARRLMSTTWLDARSGLASQNRSVGGAEVGAYKVKVLHLELVEGSNSAENTSSITERDKVDCSEQERWNLAAPTRTLA